MQPAIAEAKPPYVVFEVRAVEDRDETIKQGHYVGKDVDYAIITPQGSKDRIERVVSEWFQNLEQMVAEERFPREWLTAYRNMFRDWKAGLEVPVNGTPIVNWPALSPSQCKTFLSLNIRTVEEVATMNEEAIRRVGMGARALKDRANAWLSAAGDTGKTAEKVAALGQENADLREANERMQQQIKELAAQVQALAPKKL